MSAGPPAWAPPNSWVALPGAPGSTIVWRISTVRSAVAISPFHAAVTWVCPPSVVDDVNIAPANVPSVGFTIVSVVSAVTSVCEPSSATSITLYCCCAACPAVTVSVTLAGVICSPGVLLLLPPRPAGPHAANTITA